MSVWDAAAAGRLQRQVAELRETGVLEVLHNTVGGVWRANLARHEPSELGDTAQSLGFTSWINVAQLVDRHYANLTRAQREGVGVSLQSSALVIAACGVRVQIMKAPPSESRIPNWGQFTWSESDSRTRFQAAQNNTTSYDPISSDQDGRPQTLQPDDGLMMLWGQSADPSGLRDLILVWSGDMDTALTAGWMGMPSLGMPPWFAVAPLWMDEGDQEVATDAGVAKSPTNTGNFTERPAPALLLGLKKKPAERDQ